MNSTEILPVTFRLAQRRRVIPIPGHDADEASQSTDTPRYIYVASPVSTYSSRRYDAMVTRVAQRYPGATIMATRWMYESTPHWRETWPRVLPLIDEMVFFAELDGTVGMGVCQELQDADVCEIPIWYLHHDGQWFEPDALEFTITGQSPTKYARVEIPVDADGQTASPIGGA